MSVVTPFHNTAPYLAECIESVLSQTYAEFEYILVNNKSTDGSRQIALAYAKQDPRIRLVDNELLLEQVANYNRAIELIDPESKYCKLVQADDGIEPDSLARMVEVAERDARIGLVSSYYLKGEQVMGSGIPRGVWRLSGREACRRMLLEGRFFVGSPTTVLYRASLVRMRRPFYSLGRYHEDTEAAYEILLDHDLGFVHQVLSFNRTENPSISSATRGFNPDALDYLILVERYAPLVLSADEIPNVRANARNQYFDYLGRSWLDRRGTEFWAYHRDGLATLGWRLRRREIVMRAVREVVRLALNPERTLERSMLWIRRMRAASPRPVGRARRWSAQPPR